MKTLVITPTYNEAANIEEAIAGILSHSDADVLVVDDNSPDGTGMLADALATNNARVHVLHRKTKDGLGGAYLAGFEWALARYYDAIVEMDADGSHRAVDLPVLLAELARNPRADLVLGSRWIPGGSVQNWPRRRLLLSRLGNIYTRFMLNIDVADATGGFRVFRAQTLATLNLVGVRSQGYCFQIDLVRRVLQSGMKIVEVPITFVERTAGASKMSNAIVREALLRVTLWGVTDRLSRWRRRRK